MKKFLMLIMLLLTSLSVVACNNTEVGEVNYTVTFESNGGTDVLPVVITKDNQKISEPSVSRDGYSLEGWFKESDFTTKWKFLVDVVKSDITLYAKWSDSEMVDRLATSDPVVLGLRGARYGGDINDDFPDSNENLGFRTTINKSTEQVEMRRPSGIRMSTKPSNSSEETTDPLTTDPLYVYFNWDGSFAVMEDYTMTVDTSRTEQEVLSYNLRDFGSLEDYEVFVNYVRYRILAGGKEYIYYEGDAMMDSGSSTALVLNHQLSEYDEESDSFNIVIQRNNIDSTLADYLINNDDATLEVIGIQIFVVHRDKLIKYWDEGEEIVGSNSEYILYNEFTDLSIVTYHPELSMEVEGVPQKSLYDWQPTEEQLDVTYNYLAMFKVFYTVEENVYPDDPDAVYLTQHNIEYGETKEPKIGVQYDLNPDADDNTLYFSMPVQANSISMYEDESKYITEKGIYVDMEFLIWVGHKYENGVYKPNANKTGTVTLNDMSNLIINKVPDVDGTLIPVKFEDKIDLIGLYSIRYNQPVVNLINNETVKYPGTNDPIIVNMEFTMDWIYQGNIPIDLGESSVDEVFVVEQSMYAYKKYKFDINNIMPGKLDYAAELRRNAMSDFLERFYFEPDSLEDFAEDYKGDISNLVPLTIRIANNILYDGESVYNEIDHHYTNYAEGLVIHEEKNLPVYWRNSTEDDSEEWKWTAVGKWDDVISHDLIGESRMQYYSTLKNWLGIGLE